MNNTSVDQTTLLALMAIFVAFSALMIVLYFASPQIRNFFYSKKRKYPNYREIAGLEKTGSLTIGAKQAVREYMLRLIAVGGTIFALLAGIAGYMINDLARETAITSAITEMQKPVLDGITQLSEARRFVDILRVEVENLSNIVGEDEFVDKLVILLSTDESLEQRVRENLVDNVSERLFAEHAAELRGSPGDDGVSPELSDVARILVRDYREQLVGPPGATGNDGQSPTALAVAQALVDEHSDRLFGPRAIVEISALEFAPNLSSGVGVGVLPYGRDVMTNLDSQPRANTASFILPDTLSGHYSLWVEHAADESRSLEISFNDSLINGDALSEITNGWDEAHQRWFRQGEIEFTSYDRSILTFHRGNAFPHIRAIKLIPTLE